MQGKYIVQVLAVCLATVIVASGTPGKPLKAVGSDSPAFADADDDFLPDSVEWTMLTSSADPDSDGDQMLDFVELLQNSDPRRPDSPLPDDYQIRLVLSGPTGIGPDTLVWVHVFFRLPVGKSTDISSLDLSVEVPWLPGLSIPLDAFTPLMVTRERLVGSSQWVQLSVPLVEPALLVAIGDCTFRARANVAGLALESGMQLVPSQGDLLVLVPVANEGRFVFQSLSPTIAADGGDAEPNRVCMLELREIGAGPGGVQYQVMAAECEDANELECAATCEDSVNWVITIPGGTGLIGGN